MFRPLFVFIGTRYTRAKRRNHFVSFISLTSMIGLALGVVVMIVVLSVMNGFDHEMRTRVLGMVPHATSRPASRSATGKAWPPRSSRTRRWWRLRRSPRCRAC
jgi:lipoprotein-releasing system permease protein